MKTLRVTVNGKTYDVQVEELATGAAPAPVPAQTAAPAAAPEPVVSEPAPAAGEGETIECPMPGTIISVNVTAGQSVKSGDILVVLEAMKMENEIMAPRDGVVTGVMVSKGESVESGKPLVTFK